MARPLDQLFQIDLVLAEGGLGFSASRLDLALQFLRRADHPHATPTAAPGGLQHDGITNLLSQAGHLV